MPKQAQYERILGKALMGRGAPAEHWAHSEYAWLVFEDGDLVVRSCFASVQPAAQVVITWRLMLLHTRRANLCSPCIMRAQTVQAAPGKALHSHVLRP